MYLSYLGHTWVCTGSWVIWVNHETSDKWEGGYQSLCLLYTMFSRLTSLEIQSPFCCSDCLFLSDSCIMFYVPRHLVQFICELTAIISNLVTYYFVKINKILCAIIVNVKLEPLMQGLLRNAVLDAWCVQIGPGGKEYPLALNTALAHCSKNNK